MPSGGSRGRGGAGGSRSNGAPVFRAKRKYDTRGLKKSERRVSEADFRGLVFELHHTDRRQKKVKNGSLQRELDRLVRL